MNDQIDYREMYYRMAKATERAIRLLVSAQLECEELYLKACEGPLPYPMPSYDEKLAEILRLPEL
ncbi:MAG: hypothetical protein IJ453_06560 [Oscillospiraceae bacterium]|nr:hypothetical protein [Oscillospiraceae bacterium]